jgi:hypothetical protein
MVVTVEGELWTYLRRGNLWRTGLGRYGAQTGPDWLL